MATLKNPALPGDVEFDTFIYGAPPLAYPASLSQYTIYNTPDPGIHHRPDQRFGVRQPGLRHPMAVYQHERAAQRTCLRAAWKRPFPTRSLRARQPQPAREFHARIFVSVQVAGVARNHRGDHRRQLPQRIQLRRKRRQSHRSSRTPQAVSDLEQHGDSSFARQGRSEPDSHRGTFAWRRGGRTRVVLQSARLDRSRASGWIRGAWPVSIRLDCHCCDRSDRPAIHADLWTNCRSRFLLRHSRQPGRGRLHIRGLPYLRTRACRRSSEPHGFRWGIQGDALGAQGEPQSVQQHLGVGDRRGRSDAARQPGGDCQGSPGEPGAGRAARSN